MKTKPSLIAVLLLILGFYRAPATAQVDCSQILDKAKAFHTRVTENNSAIATFVGEVSIALDSWYFDFSQFEDSTVAIAPDYFSPLKDAADGIGGTVDVAYEQMDILDREGQELVDLIEGCTAAAPLRPQPPAALTP